MTKAPTVSDVGGVLNLAPTILRYWGGGGVGKVVGEGHQGADGAENRQDANVRKRRIGFFGVGTAVALVIDSFFALFGRPCVWLCSYQGFFEKTLALSWRPVVEKMKA